MNERTNETKRTERTKKRRRTSDLDMAEVLFFDIHSVLFEGAVMFVDQVSIQGKPGTTKSVTQFYLKTSTDGVYFSYIVNGSHPVVK